MLMLNGLLFSLSSTHQQSTINEIKIILISFDLVDLLNCCVDEERAAPASPAHSKTKVFSWLGSPTAPSSFIHFAHSAYGPGSIRRNKSNQTIPPILKSGMRLICVVDGVLPCTFRLFQQH